MNCTSFVQSPSENNVGGGFQARRPGGHGAESEDDGNNPLARTMAQVADSDWEPRDHPANRALLSREDLDRHFGYGLEEAARRLGVCKTTLKRACRQAGLSPKDDETCPRECALHPCKIETVRGLSEPSFRFLGCFLRGGVLDTSSQ